MLSKFPFGFQVDRNCQIPRIAATVGIRNERRNRDRRGQGYTHHRVAAAFCDHTSNRRDHAGSRYRLRIADRQVVTALLGIRQPDKDQIKELHGTARSGDAVVRQPPQCTHESTRRVRQSNRRKDERRRPQVPVAAVRPGHIDAQVRRGDQRVDDLARESARVQFRGNRCETVADLVAEAGIRIGYRGNCHWQDHQHRRQTRREPGPRRGAAQHRALEQCEGQQRRANKHRLYAGKHCQSEKPARRSRSPRSGW